MLLDAGADPSTAIHCAITYEDDVGLKAPLDRGSCLFAPSITPKIRNFWHVGWYSESILSYAPWYTRVRRNFNPKILPLVIEALVRSRRCLMALANKHLPISTLRRLGWKDSNDNGTLLDSAAIAVFRCLEDADVKKTDALRPGPMKTVYHDTWMTADCAEILVSAHFQEVDTLDKQGFLPLLLICHYKGNGTCWERNMCLLWFLRHGAKQVVFRVLNRNSTLHILASNLGYPWTPGSPNKHLLV